MADCVALLALAVAEEAEAVAEVAEAVAELAEAVALVDAEALSTSNVYLAELALDVRGWDPEDVCVVLT